jgi:hypothetical protein
MSMKAIIRSLDTNMITGDETSAVGVPTVTKLLINDSVLELTR